MTDMIKYTHAVHGARSEENLGKVTPPASIRAVWLDGRIKEGNSCRQTAYCIQAQCHFYPLFTVESRPARLEQTALVFLSYHM